MTGESRSPQIVTIVMPIYNAARTLARAVNSLNRIAIPHRPRLHVIGVDDGSTDDSATVFARTAAAVEGLLWTLLSRPNGGSGAARNDALRTFSSGWTLCLDADDELLADPFPFIDRSPQASALLFDADYHMDEKPLFTIPARRPDAQRLRQIFSTRSPYCTLSIIFRRELLDHLFAEDLRYLEDWHFLAVNPHIFAHCSVHRGIALGRVHGSKQSKSADQYKNGFYRVAVADRLTSFWAGEPSPTIRNNLALQRAIGQIQMGAKRDWSSFLKIPASPSLYAKLCIYSFFFRIYLALYPYR